MSAPEWKPSTRDYEKERKISLLPHAPAPSHPLQPRSKPTTQKNTTPEVSDPLEDPLKIIDDPLSAFAVPPKKTTFVDPLLHLNDPLSAPVVVNPPKTVETVKAVVKPMKVSETQVKTKTAWELKKEQMTKEFTVSGNITLNRSAINDFAGSGVEDGSATRHLDKYTQRLANLEKREIKEEKVELTQNEYANHVKKLSLDLRRAWENDERVASLKIVIQVAKLLADTTVPQFYPSMFVMITEVLDDFGNMVFKRLKNRAEEVLMEEGKISGSKNVGLSEHFTANDVPGGAKETARNWFYKISCIRELLPRLYVELSIFKCYRFLTDSDFTLILTRIGSMIRGIGDPLVSTFARAYLVVVTDATVPHLTMHHSVAMLQDILYTSSSLRDPHMEAEFGRCDISSKGYHFLLTPAVDWIFSTVGHGASRELFQTVLQLFHEHCQDCMILKAIIDNFEAAHYINNLVGMVALVKNCHSSCFTNVDCFTSLAKKLLVTPPPEEQRLAILNEVWRFVAKSHEVLPYVRCTYAWIELVQKYYTEREMLVLMANLAKKLESSRGDLADNVSAQLDSLLGSLISKNSSFGAAVLTSEHLLRILDAFKGTKKVELCKDILDYVSKQPATNDAVLINTVFDIGRLVHDSVDCLSPMADVEYVSSLLSNFVDKIDFGRDVEQQLNFYVECRAAFCNLDSIKDKLILCVSGLSVKAFKIMKGRHSKKTSTFVKACLAYCHITIPSITSVFRKLQLLLRCAQISLLNQCLPQTDTFLKAAISLLPDAPKSEAAGNIQNQEQLANFIAELLSTLVITPGHPDHGPFYIVQGLMNAIPRYPWQAESNTLTKVYINLLSLLCTFSQRRFPYSLNGVQANDELYGGAASYQDELKELIQECMTEILKNLTSLGEASVPTAKVVQSTVAVDLINELTGRMDLSHVSSVEFVIKLVDLVAKQKGVFKRNDLKYFISTVQFVITKIEKADIIDADLDFQPIVTLKQYL